MSSKSYNEEMAELYKSLGLDGFELRPLTDAEKAKPDEWANLEKRIALKTEYNRNVEALSSIYAMDSLPCQSNGKVYSLGKRFNTSNKRGFTLAELLIVVAIIAVLTAVSIPIFTNTLSKSNNSNDTGVDSSAVSKTTTKEKITIVNNELELMVGQEIELAVEDENAKSVKNFKCESSNFEIANVTEDCKVVGISVGEVVITVTKNGQKASINLNVIESEAEQQPVYYPQVQPQQQVQQDQPEQPGKTVEQQSEQLKEEEKKSESDGGLTPTPDPEPEPDVVPPDPPVDQNPEPEFVGFEG